MPVGRTGAIPRWRRQILVPHSRAVAERRASGLCLPRSVGRSRHTQAAVEILTTHLNGAVSRRVITKSSPEKRLLVSGSLRHCFTGVASLFSPRISLTKRKGIYWNSKTAREFTTIEEIPRIRDRVNTGGWVACTLRTWDFFNHFA